MTIRLIVLLFALVGCSSVIAQGTKIGVKVTVSADGGIKSDIESYVKRELRALNDINIYALNPKFEIQLVAIDPSSVIAISYVVIRKNDFTSYVNTNVNPRITDPKVREFVTKSLAVKSYVSLHGIQSSSAELLESLCKRIVAKIDTDVFEFERTFNNIIESLANESPAKPSQDTKPKTTTKPESAGESPFQREYVGGEKTLIAIQNQTDRTLTLVFGGVKYTLAAKAEREIEVEGGRYEYSASVPRLAPIGGVKNFGTGYRFSWRFFIVRR